MPHPLEQEGSRRLAHRILAPSRHFQRFRWLVLLIASLLEIALVLVVHATASAIHPLDPVGAGVVFLSVAAGAVGGALAGLGTALVGVFVSFVILADFSTPASAGNAVVSAVLWCIAATVTGLIVSYLRRQVAHRETALEQALSRSLSAREKLERVLDFTAQLHVEGDLSTAARAICDTAVATFGSDSARLYALKGPDLELLAMAPSSDHFRPGLLFPLADNPELEETLHTRRPSFLRDLRHLRLKSPAFELQHELRIVSVIRVPIVGTGGAIGLLSLSWDHLIGRPGGELLAIMQRFGDQATITWSNALRVEAQERAEELRATLDRVLALAPSFHIRGAREEVAEAICEAALATFECTAVALYRVEGDRARVLSRLPGTEQMKAGVTLPLSCIGAPVERLSEGRPLFVRDLADTLGPEYPWLERVLRQTGTRSVIFVPLRLNQHGPRNLLALAWDRVRDDPGESMTVVVQRFADQASLALQNASAAQLHARLEANLLPSIPTTYPGLHIVTRYRTGEQRLSLGGDFLGTTPADDGLLHFAVGDVSGHGPNAAALGATLRVTWKSLAMTGHDLKDILSVMTEVLMSERVGDTAYATLVAGKLDLESRRLTLINAGHLPPILATGGNAIPLATSPAPPLGFADPSRYATTEFPLPEAWALMCYTDGLIDARLTPNSDERFGEDRLVQRLSSWPIPNLEEEHLDTLMREVEAGNGGPFADDVAVLLISTDTAGEPRVTRPYPLC